ncbi:hypothetical protein [Micromonospora sp. NPDC002575]|uniref:hypothetical protein n=1 Tax=Micromonospora sp. NPDC002575 TaxID=3364222 RepID=UPI00368D6F16
MAGTRPEIIRLSRVIGFLAVTLGESIERPEALDAGGIVMTGPDPAGVVEAVRP